MAQSRASTALIYLERVGGQAAAGQGRTGHPALPFLLGAGSVSPSRNPQQLAPRSRAWQGREPAPMLQDPAHGWVWVPWGARPHPVPTPTCTAEAPWAPRAVRMLRGSSPGEVLELPLGTTQGLDVAP